MIGRTNDQLGRKPHPAIGNSDVRAMLTRLNLDPNVPDLNKPLSLDGVFEYLTSHLPAHAAHYDVSYNAMTGDFFGRITTHDHDVEVNALTPHLALLWAFDILQSHP